MSPHYFYSSVTRRSDLWTLPFETRQLPFEDWATGDFVAGRTVGKRNRLYQCETKVGRMADMVRGDLMIGALGQREATLEGVGDWRKVEDDLELEALTSAGLMGKSTSISPFLPELMRLEYCGHVVRDENKVCMMDFVEATPKRRLDIPVILLIGTSMSSGKTKSGQVIIRALKYLGLRVAGAKLTGAARFRDILTFRDAGADEVIDFVDAGLPSTVCEEAQFREAMDWMTSRIAAANVDVLVAEAGASPLEPYNGSVVVEYLQHLARFNVLCASDPYAVLGVQTAYGNGLRPDIVAGPAANTEAAYRLVHKLCGLKALNLLDRRNYPELVERLKTALNI